MNRFGATTPTALAVAFAEAASKELTTLCPISGLLVPNNFPAYIGALFTGTVHPVVAEAKNLVKLGDSYLTTLSNEQLSGLLLALLASYNKVDLDGPAFLVRARLETTCTGGQLLTFIKWFTKAIAITKRSQPKLALSQSSDEITFDSYMKQWVSIERFYSQVDIQLAEMAKSQTIEAPAFLSNASQAKKLNKACYEAYKEASLHLPKPLVAKLKPFVTDLAITTNVARLERMLEAIKGAVGFEEELLAGSEEVEAVADFLAVLETKRSEAKELGLDKDDWQFDDLQEAITSHKVAKAVQKYHSEVGGLGLMDQLKEQDKLEEVDLTFPSLPAQAVLPAPTTFNGQPTATKLSFSEKLALAKAAKETR